MLHTTLLASHSEYPRDKLCQYKREKKFPRALSELPVNWPGRFSQTFFFLIYILILIYFSKYETIVTRNGLSLGYSERDTSSVISNNIYKKLHIPIFCS